MLTKNCKCILDAILALDGSMHFQAHSLKSLSQQTGLSFDSVLAACRELENNKFATLKVIRLPREQVIPEAITLTEFGKNYKSKLASEKKSFLLKSVYIPIAVTLITNGILAALKWLWPQIQQWLSRVLG